MARYDNIDVNGKNAFENKTPSYDSIMKQKAKDTNKALHKQKKEEDAKAADKAMQEEVDKEYEAQKEVEKQAIKNNGSSIENRDYNKTVQETSEEPVKEIKTQVEETEVEKPNVEEPKVEEPKVEEKKEPTNLTEAFTNQGIPENVASELMESDEGKEADEIIASGNPAKLQNIVAPDGQAILKGSYDENGNYVPYTYTEADTRLVKNKGWAAALTIISGALSVLGIVAGIPIVPINFFKFGASPQEDLERMNQVEKDYAALMNAGTAEAQEIEKTEGAKTAAYESNAQAAIENPELYESDVQNKVAGASAALAGGNTQLQTQESQQDWQAVQNDLDRQFQKEMKDKDISGQIAILRQNGVNQKELATLMNDLEVQEVFKKAQIAEERGMKPDELAKWIRGMNGTTTLEAYAPAVSSLLGSALGIAGGMGTAAVQGANMAKQAALMNPSANAYNAAASNSAMLNRNMRDRTFAGRGSIDERKPSSNTSVYGNGR